ncbi:MAG: hypothetical protein Q4B03_02890 [Lachnospiraceae bacterium]|nr:hypothetical protein [Lachnospiraceae bacterium]
MEKKIFAVYDPDPEFVFRFMEFAKLHSGRPMDIRACTTEESLQRMCETTSPELLLVASSVFSEKLRELNAGTIVLLQEDQEYDCSNLPAVYKYQAPAQVLQKVLEYGGKKQEMVLAQEGKTEMELIGIYSPVGRTRKTSFALTLGQILAKNRAVLYLNLETFAGFEQLFSEKYDRTLSDLLYFAGQDRAELQSKLPGIVRSLQNLDYVPPVFSPEDLQSVPPEEWLRLFRQLEEHSSYEILLIDFGEAVQDLPALLAACDRVYLPVRKDPMSRAKLEQFFWVLEKMQGTEIQKKLRKITLPFCQNGKTGKRFFEDLVWSELGDFVRQLLSEEVRP